MSQWVDPLSALLMTIGRTVSHSPSLAIGSLQHPDKLLEAIQVYLTSFDVVMHDKREDWASVEENIARGKALLEVLSAYRAAVAGSVTPSALQLVAIDDGNDAGDNE